MIFTLDLNSGEPIYLQIASAVRGRLARGELSPGDRLPPGRELAAALGVNLETVQRAYRLLADDGLVTSRVGRGTRIAEDLDLDRLQVDGLVDDLISRAKGVGLTPADVVAAIKRRWTTETP